MSKTFELVKSLYKDGEGKPIELTEGQVKIFDAIFKKEHPRNQITCYTRYGKSFTVALAVLTRIITFPEKWAIVAPSEKKAKIIMSYIIEHTFDNDIAKQKLEIGKDETLEHLRRERSKSRLVYKHSDGTYGEVFIISADSRNKLQSGDALMGFGAPHVILDEAALIDDDIEAKIFRMLGDSVENFYFKIGNPFNRNHFLKSFKDPNYFKMNIDYKVGLSEGRIKQEFVDEAKKKPHFGVLYENQFPEEDAVDSKGFSQLLTDKQIDDAKDYIEPEARFGPRVIGLDVAHGGRNYNVWVLRCDNFAQVLGRNQDKDLMSVVGTTVRFAREHNVSPENISVDSTGVGAGLVDRLHEVKYDNENDGTLFFYVNPVILAAKADEEERYVNRRAENYWRLRDWIIKGGKLYLKDDWSELSDIKYKAQDSSGKLIIMSKDDMMRQGIESPDVADALMFTFDRDPLKWEELKAQNQAYNRNDIL